MSIENSLPSVGVKSLGYSTPFGVLLPPGSKVAAYVSSSSSSLTDSYSSSGLLVQTLNAGLARCRAGKGDVVVVLPGHTENVTTADFFSSLVAGTQIIGAAPFGSGLMPTLTFTNTAATFLLDVANVVLTGIKFAVGVDALVNFVNITGSGCYVSGNVFNMGAAAALDMQTAVIVGNSASDLTVEANRFVNTGTGVSTAALLVSGTGVDNLSVKDNEFFCNCATTGVVNVTGTGINMNFRRNTVFNRTATTPIGMRFTDTAIEALVAENTFGFLTGITVTTGAITVVGATTSEIRTSQNFGVDADTVNAVVCGTGTAT